MDKYKIKITDQAKEHLKLIKDYIANQLKEPNVAKKILFLLKEEMMSLESLPHRIKCIDESPWGELGFRKLKVKNYYVYFMIDENEKKVNIIAIIYSRADQENQLKNL